MAKVFKQFDADGDGKLDIYELARAFRAIGLEKRDGEKSDMDKAMFKSFDSNGDGYCDMEELEKNMEPKLRKKIEEKLDAGWKFDKETWDASVARHKKYDMKQIFAQFDADGDGKLDIYEIARAFRALGLPKRDGSKMEMDKVRSPLPCTFLLPFTAYVHALRRPRSYTHPQAMFKSFDSNGDGFVTLEEFQENLLPKTRRKIEMKLKEGWTFDKEKWQASLDRHCNDTKISADGA